jgi:hypothetical protein
VSKRTLSTLIDFNHPDTWRCLRDILKAESTRPLDLVLEERWRPSTWDCPGVYRLWVDEHCYIGMSQNVGRRISTHGIQWHKAGVLQLWHGASSVPRKQLYEAETYWITLLRPQLNSQFDLRRNFERAWLKQHKKRVYPHGEIHSLRHSIVNAKKLLPRQTEVDALRLA